MTRATSLLVLAALAALETACATRTAHVLSIPTDDRRAQGTQGTGSATPRAPTAEGHVQLFAGREPAGRYVVLGLVVVESHAGEDPLALLASGAARLGADAVVRVRHERIPGGVVTRGIAVAFVTAAARAAP